MCASLPSPAASLLRLEVSKFDVNRALDARSEAGGDGDLTLLGLCSAEVSSSFSDGDRDGEGEARRVLAAGVVDHDVNSGDEGKEDSGDDGLGGGTSLLAFGSVAAEGEDEDER